MLSNDIPAAVTALEDHDMIELPDPDIAYPDTHREQLDETSTSCIMLSALQQILKNPNANFKSVEQGRIIREVLRRKKDIIGVMPTGGGKSFIFMVPAAMEENKTTVVVVPLVALTADLIQRAVKAGISATRWSANESSLLRMNTPRLLFVAMENAVKENFRGFLLELAHQERLARIVFDEAHLLVSWAEFRPLMRSLVSLRSVSVPNVFCSATLPPTLVKKLQTAMAIEDFILIRQLTSRLNLQYTVHVTANKKQAYEKLKLVLKSALPNCRVEDRILVFFPTIHDSEEAAENLQHFLQSPVLVYNSSRSQLERERVQNEFQAGTHQVICATCAFGIGIEYAHIRTVIHMHYSHSMLQYVQESGRAGRNGEAADCIAIFSTEDFGRAVNFNGANKEELAEVADYFRDKKTCR